ncbi:bifunctional precorrin-2 dehydrogenase/sirohydrochlorin ferrochelatase [Selenomonas sp. TAMA-11512]|uniref:precorrin-2 dehydrogenase/sirohydrochlorin ferrochelatase family protein n=1 Tax=Selenomonas sp. TAMA-11512 TaxID=3095337 RepID=UPI003091366E|nr:bifunctional precorrin-2 dehydrogenase/sirohydrochlorin ferrochelatase [Selenomonas sp. TAMA-11512]
MYPINLNLDGRPCLVIGGGTVAERKVKKLLEEGARVTVMSPHLTDELIKLREEGEIYWQNTYWNEGAFFRDTFTLVFCATNDASLNARAAKQARGKGSLVNVVSDVSLCDFVVPARVTRGDLLMTVSTGGSSPAFARVLKERIDEEYGDVYGAWLDRLQVIRAEVKEKKGSAEDRNRFWRTALSEHVLELVENGSLEEAEGEVRDAADQFGIES